ncbi:hypothetical protein ACLX1H_011304 [Fusarium chlamydosporum]
MPSMLRHEEHRTKLRYLQRFHKELIDPSTPLTYGKGVEREALIAKINTSPWVVEAAKKVAPLLNEDGEKIKDDVKYPKDWLLKARSFNSETTTSPTQASHLLEKGINTPPRPRHPALSIAKASSGHQLIQGKGFLFGPPPDASASQPAPVRLEGIRLGDKRAPEGLFGNVYEQDHSSIIQFGQRPDSDVNDLFRRDRLSRLDKCHQVDSSPKGLAVSKQQQSEQMPRGGPVEGTSCSTVTEKDGKTSGKEQRDDSEPTALTEKVEAEFDQVAQWFTWWAERHNKKLSRE